MGSRALRDPSSRRNPPGPWIAYLDAGLVVFGKTNTPEWGNHCTTEPLLFGPTVNPWSAAVTPGGSSGGSAAARGRGGGARGLGRGTARAPFGYRPHAVALVGLKPRRGRSSFAPGGRPRTRRPGEQPRADPHGARQRGPAGHHRRLRTRRSLQRRRPGVLLPRRSRTNTVGAAHPGSPPLLRRFPPAGSTPRWSSAVEAAGRVLESLGHHLDPGTPRSMRTPSPTPSRCCTP